VPCIAAWQVAFKAVSCFARLQKLIFIIPKRQEAAPGACIAAVTAGGAKAASCFGGCHQRQEAALKALLVLKKARIPARPLLSGIKVFCKDFSCASGAPANF
jgi:hypothetical protein